MGSFIKYHSVNIQQLKQFDLRIVYAETNRVDVGSYPPAPTHEKKGRSPNWVATFIFIFEF